ncbi:MAG TPA: bifunctional diaminohydroxyphosphoribosylaminopyrimidine deaminase/5-amino-6-(5-phosphoribosylamino)uracil reductase RibD [Bacteroidia bacterium]
MQEFNPYPPMQRALLLAEMGLGSVAPNPMVGCVIMHDAQLIGEGYHQKYGEAHAEVNAINSVKDKSLLAKSVMYLSLEPCSHTGKTPPCSDLIIAHKLKRVVVACIDFNPLVAGKGIEKLRSADIEVRTDLLRNEARKLNKRFFTFHEKKRPYIILKWAKTKDGFISKHPPFTRKDNWITNEKSNKLVHTWRTQEQALLVGTNTALLDNPALTVRLVEGKNPIRILIDKDLKVPPSYSIFSPEAETLVFTQKDKQNSNHIAYHKIDVTQDSISQILEALYHKEITSLIVEGGAHTLQSFIDKGLWDEARVFTGNKFFKEGVKAPILPQNKLSLEMIGDDELAVFTR